MGSEPGPDRSSDPSLVPGPQDPDEARPGSAYADAETGAWSFESDELDQAGGDERYEGEPGRASYDEGVVADGETWYDPQSSGWEAADAPPGVQGWEGEAGGQGWEGEAGGQGWYADEYYYQDDYTAAYARSRQQAVAAYQTAYGKPAPPRTWDEGDPVPQARPPMRANGPWPELAMIAAVAVVIAAVILAVTGAGKVNVGATQTTLSTVPSTARTSKPAAKGSHPTTPVRSTLPPTTPPTQPTTTVTAVPHARALPVTPNVQLSLIRSWLATNPGGVGLGLKDVAGTVPQQVFYAEQPQTSVFWALVAFQPSQTVLAEQSTAAGQDALAQFQDTDYIFNWKSGPTWNELGYVSTGDCPGDYVPSSVLAAWGLCGFGPANGG